MTQEVSMGGNVMMGMVVTPEFGVNSQQGMDLPMEADELSTHQASLQATEYLAMSDLGYTSVLKGIHANRGEPVYIVEVSKGDEVVKELRFSTESGLLVAIQRAQSGPMGVVQIAETFDAYKEFDGLLFATEHTQTANGQQMSFKINEVELNGKVDTQAFTR